MIPFISKEIYYNPEERQATVKIVITFTTLTNDDNEHIIVAIEGLNGMIKPTPQEGERK